MRVMDLPRRGPHLTSRPSSASGGAFAIRRGVEKNASAISFTPTITTLSIDAVDMPGERRRRSIRRGAAILDVLDNVQAALLGGADPRNLAQQLAGAIQERSEEADPALSRILRQIETRAAVELAKLEAVGGRPG